MKPIDIVERAGGRRVLVFGSLPPAGRDLDLLVRSPERVALEKRLGAEGFERRGGQWVRFSGCSLELVDLVAAEGWGLPNKERQLLFDEAVPLDGFSRAVRPAPHHALLILARRVAESGGEIDDKRRERIRGALGEDPAAWDRARGCAGAWSATESLDLLETTYKSGVPATRRRRATAIAERLRGARSSPVAYVTAWKRTLGGSDEGAVVAFSGLDGSGKSSQAEALRLNLERLGYPAVVVWTRLSYNPLLNVVARPVKRAMLWVRGVDDPAASPETVADAETKWRAAKDIRSGSAALTFVWATIVALANAGTQRRTTRYHLARRRIVICDRYCLDSSVHLRYRYGESHTFRFQTRLVKTLSPKPLREYLLEIPGEVALQRKAEQYDLKQLKLQARLYREESRAYSVTHLDATRAREDLCEEISRDVWRALAR
jgi:thymidylate kinase